MRRLALTLAVLLAAGTAAGAACNSGGGSGGGIGSDARSGTTTSSAPTTTTTEAAAPAPERDQEAARGIVLTAADVGPRYSLGSAGQDASPILCPYGIDFLEGDDARRGAESSFFAGMDGISANVDFAGSTADADKAFKVVTSDFYVECVANDFADGLRAAHGPSVKVEASGTRQTMPALAVPATAVRLALRESGPGVNRTGYVEFVFLRKGRALAHLYLTSKERPFDSAERDRLASILAARLNERVT